MQSEPCSNLYKVEFTQTYCSEFNQWPEEFEAEVDLEKLGKLLAQARKFLCKSKDFTSVNVEDESWLIKYPIDTFNQTDRVGYSYLTVYEFSSFWVVEGKYDSSIKAEYEFETIHRKTFENHLADLLKVGSFPNA